MLVEVTPDGLYVCPVCNKALFASPSDLMHHIIAHARGLTNKLVKVAEKEEKEEEEESEQ
ncbi:MAG: C2H2-type zinc finger protein [Acidilobaceae archaeon]